MPDEQTTYYIRPLTTNDRNWVADFLDTHWHSTKIVALGEVYYGHLMPGFAVFPGSPEDETDANGETNHKAKSKEKETTKEKKKPQKPIGLVTFRIDEEGDCHVLTMDSLDPKKGIGTALLNAVRTAAMEAGCKRLWLVTTNDNMQALRFYQRRGFVLVALHVDSLANARRLKPQIPLIGIDNIPLRDELVLESPI